MLALIDGDILAFRSAVVTDNADSPALAIWRTEQTLLSILENTNADQHFIFIGGNDNFRKQVDPEYKAHRTKPKPKYLKDIEQFLMENYGAIRVHGIETDDALGILQTEQSVICSIDKDLLQVPGKHYQWTTNTWLDISDQEGIKHFYKQLLIGDRADNIFGVDKIGKVKASKLIDPLDDPEDMFNLVRKMYNDDDRLERNCHLLWILKSHNLFHHPDLKKLEPKPEVRLESIQEMETGLETFMEVGMTSLIIDGTQPHG